jgi:hypothetical protein
MPQNAEQPSLPNNLHKGIPLYAIIDCIENKNLSITDTAKLLDTTKSNVSERLSKAGIKPNYLTKYKTHRSDILASYQQIILNSLTSKDLEKAGLSQKMMALGILYDKERLERGQSTENVAYADITRQQALVDKQLASFRDKYGLADDNIK